MSNSTPSGDRSSIPSPRPLQARPSNDAPSSSRHGTTGTKRVETLNAYAPTPSSGPHEIPRQQYEYSQTPADNAPQSQSRGFGVHSILNPSSEVIQQSPMTTPRLSAASAGPTLLPPPTASSPRGRKRAEPGSPTRAQTGGALGASGRRVLTPKSPATRAASLGGRRNPTFHPTGPPQQSLGGPEWRIYTAEPGTADVPSLPPISSAARTILPGINNPDVWPAQGRPQGAGPSVVTTQSASPSTSHTSQSQTEQASPAFRYGQMPVTQGPSHYRSHHFGMHMGLSSEQGSQGGPDSYQTGQTGYQMTLETDQGPMVVPVELDLRQASKVADEKRKRNAGASARFRARRKEKEKEASHTISSLQQDLRELRESRDFYRNQCNFIRDFAARQHGLQLPPRPPSPVFQRTRAPSSYDESSGMEDIGRARSDSAPAAHRRRTGDYLPGFPTVSQQSPRPFGYPPNPAMPMQTTPVHGQAPGPYTSPRTLPPGPPGSGAPLQQRSQSSYDPFRKDPFDRSWNPGG